MKPCIPTQFCRVKVLVGNGIAPGIQIFQYALPSVIIAKVSSHFSPERYAKPPKIVSQVAWVRISFIDLSILNEQRPQHILVIRRRPIDDIVDTLRMKIATEPLELR